VTGGDFHLADTSAFTAALRNSGADEKLRKLFEDGLLATFVTVDLEMGFSARTPLDHQYIWVSRSRFLQLACVDEIAVRARQVQALMATTSQHRAAGIIDLLTAAAAEHYGCTLLHYDADFDHIAKVTHQSCAWIVEQGSA
jgi:predicted nucleic acid-binding protein